MFVLAHNMAAMYTQRQLNINSKSKASSTEKLSSGYKINRAADDAANLAISEKMRKQIRGLGQGMKNITDGISWVQIGDAAMGESQSMVQRMNELSIQAANGTLSDSDRTSINEEMMQLRQGIDEISRTTKFNELYIFDNDTFQLDLEEYPDQALQVFDSSYDDATGEFKFGGMILGSTRYSWDFINKDMVDYDPVTGKQSFKKGEYSYTSGTGTAYHFSVKEDGLDFPDVSIDISIKAVDDALYIGDVRIPWDNVLDEDDLEVSDWNSHEGTWAIDYDGVKASFYVGDVNSKQELINEINSFRNGKTTYRQQKNFKGYGEEQAVDMSGIPPQIQMSEYLVDKIMTAADYKLTIHAGKDPAANADGIWLEDNTGARIDGSYKTWSQLGISSWMNGDDIQDYIQYIYSDTEGVEDTYLSFNFSLSDVTSVDSVIDGLDGVVIQGQGIQTNYETDVALKPNTNVISFSSTVRSTVSFEEEKALNRDFSQQVIDNVSESENIYDTTDGKVAITFKNPDTGAAVISFEGVPQTADLTDTLDEYTKFVLKAKKNILLAGKDPQTEELKLGGSLTTVLGTDHITTEGYFAGDVTLTNSMILSQGGKGQLGKTYPTAQVDFSGLGTSYNLDDLVMLGFNSTCKTCDNHYSIQFAEGSTKTTADGYGYDFVTSGNNYTLKIDVDTLKANGVTTGADLTQAITKITNGVYDFHFTQYAAEGAKLYVYDNRVLGPVDDRANATFDTTPYDVVAADVAAVTIDTNTADGRTIKLDYQYSIADIADQIEMTWKEDTSGNYVKDADGSYKVYNPADYEPTDPTPVRYSMSTIYKKKDGAAAANLSDLLADYEDHAIKNMLDNTTIQLDATDYTFISVDGDEKNNVAINAIFDSKLIKETDEGIRIQASDERTDYLKIPQFAMTAAAMRIYRPSVLTQKDAERTIDKVSNALKYVSEKRALYGAYQNRMEHTYKRNDVTKENTENAESQIRDTDMAEEMVSFSKNNILEQVGEAMLAQANQNPQGVLQLLQ